MSTDSTDKKHDFLRSLLLRRLIFVVFGICLFSTSISLWKTQEARSLSQMHEQIIYKASNYAHEVELNYNKIYKGLEKLSKMSSSQKNENVLAWQEDAIFFVGIFKGISKIFLLDINMVIQSVVPYNENEDLINKSMSSVVTEQSEVDVLQAINVGEEFVGFILGKIDIEKFISSIIMDNQNNYMFHLSNENKVIFESKDWESSREEFTINKIIVLENSQVWNLSFAPTKELYATEIELSRKTLFLSLVFTIIMLGLVYFGNSYSETVKLLEYKKQSEEKYRLLTENSSDVISVYNFSINRFTYFSPSIFQLRGITVEEAMNESLEDALTPTSLIVIKTAIEKTMNDFLEKKNVNNSYTYEIQQPCKNGNIVWVEMSTRYRFNSEGQVETVGVSRNINERKKTEDKILYLIYHDQLTGLYNRRFFEEELERHITDKNFPLSIIMSDVNGLKLINDSFGYAFGDELLKKVAQLLKMGCRYGDIIARLGGDEFVIILPNTNYLESDLVIKRLKGLMHTEKLGSIDISISFGCGTKVNEGKSIQEILKDTEDDMYRHKLYESTSMRSKTIDLIMNTFFEKNNREMLHSKRVSEICECIAIKMNFDKDAVNQIRLAGLMHDIGKIGIDEKILNKTQKLDNKEWDEIKRHSEIGYRILSSVNEFSEIAQYVLEHQERWDGKGYPKGLRGDEISLQARIIAVADSYDAMTGNRTYKKALSEEEAINEIWRCSGSQFDPEVVKAFIEMHMEKIS